MDTKVKPDAIPRMRLAEIEFRLEILEAAVAAHEDELELMRAEREKKRQRDAWDGR